MSDWVTEPPTALVAARAALAPTINTTARDYRTDYKLADGTPIQHIATLAPEVKP